MLTLSCHNMEIKTAIGNRGFLMYKKYRCLYKHISNSSRNIFNWFPAFERVVSLQLPIGPFSQIRSHIYIYIYIGSLSARF